ncbi:MAG: TatD family hydrolase [Lautropia sp.]|nr:TatD family hydrolase [Lautropia sp.]
MLIDSHCHLDAAEFEADRDAVWAKAHEQGVSMVVVPAVHRANWPAVQALAEQHEGVFFALGIHPLYVNETSTDDLQALSRLLTTLRDHPRLVGIGEIGLDFFVPGLDRGWQQQVFEAQLRLARDLDLPVILHSRRAVDQVTRALRRFRPAGGIAHAFNGSSQQATQLIALKMALGFGGAMTFERARNIRRLASSLPAECLVLETDAPDISPAWLHPGRNAPTELPRIAEVLAGLRGWSLLETARITSDNACRVLPRLRESQTHQAW